MKISINSPAYYTQSFGVIEEIYQLSKKISNNIEVSQYTDSLDIIGITPIIVPDALITDQNWKEERKILLSSKMAILSLRIDYNTFCRADLNEKKRLFLENIFNSLKVIKDRLKTDFNYDKMLFDIKEISK